MEDEPEVIQAAQKAVKEAYFIALYSTTAFAISVAKENDPELSKHQGHCKFRS